MPVIWPRYVRRTIAQVFTDPRTLVTRRRSGPVNRSLG
jgi:hypothetical protein